MKSTGNRLYKMMFALAVVAGGLGAYGFVNGAIESKQSLEDAQKILAERCVVTPDGRTLKTVSSNAYPRFAAPAKVVVDKDTGKEFILGDVFTIDGRNVEMFHTSRIKLVKCS
jgi:hypothetical protein|nr:hypothetical protein [Neorhizobium tomejilense]